MLNLLLARHGQSEWNAVGRWQGQADPPLSELGRAQARGAANQAGAFDAIFASDLERALHTATIISTTLGVGPVIVDPRLKERNAGEFSGLTRAEIDTQFPGMLDRGEWPPGWEDDEAVLTRPGGARRHPHHHRRPRRRPRREPRRHHLHPRRSLRPRSRTHRQPRGSLASPRRISVATRRAPAARA